MEVLYHPTSWKVGYWITERKYKRLNFSLFEILCRSKNIKLIKLNLDEDLEQQGPFHLIVHKVSDLVNHLSDLKMAKRLERFQEYVLRHPEVKVIDPLERVFSLLNRNVQYQFAQQCNLLDGGEEYFVPSFIELTTKDFNLNRKLVDLNGVTFPLVCKSSVSMHPGKSRVLENIQDPDEMMIIFDERGLRDVEPPCVLQSFINHNARLYKIFVVGDRHFTIERPSIKNLYPQAGRSTIFFKSSDISKSNSSSVLNKLDENDPQSTLNIEVEDSKVDRLVRSLRGRFRLDLFGVDVIIENGTGRYGVIDLNPFPGYDGVRDFLPCLLELIVGRIENPETTGFISTTADDLQHPLPFSSSSSSSSSSSAASAAAAAAAATTTNLMALLSLSLSSSSSASSSSSPLSSLSSSLSSSPQSPLPSTVSQVG